MHAFPSGLEVAGGGTTMAAGGGAIINVAGRTAYQTANPPGSTCTGPAKAAELRFTADLADELRPHGIRVNCVVPGVVVTEERFEKWEREAAANNYDPDAALARREVIVSADGPWGDAWEIADTIVYLASNRARYVNGASLLVDGANKNSYTRLLRERPYRYTPATYFSDKWSIIYFLKNVRTGGRREHREDHGANEHLPLQNLTQNQTSALLYTIVHNFYFLGRKSCHKKNTMSWCLAPATPRFVPPWQPKKMVPRSL